MRAGRCRRRRRRRKRQPAAAAAAAQAGHGWRRRQHPLLGGGEAPAPVCVRLCRVAPMRAPRAQRSVRAPERAAAPLAFALTPAPACPRLPAPPAPHVPAAAHVHFQQHRGGLGGLGLRLAALHARRESQEAGLPPGPGCRRSGAPASGLLARCRLRLVRRAGPAAITLLTYPFPCAAADAPRPLCRRSALAGQRRLQAAAAAGGARRGMRRAVRLFQLSGLDLPAC